MNPSSLSKLKFLFLVLFLYPATVAFAINFQLFKPKSFSGETLWNESTQTYRPQQWESSVTLGFARNLLEFGDPATGKRIASVVESLLSTDLFVGYGIIDHLRLEVNIPVYLFTQTSDVASAPDESKFGIGDISLKVHYSISESAPGSSRFGLAIAPFIQTPLLGSGRFLRSDHPSGGVILAADRWMGRKHYLNMNLGAHLRATEVLSNLSVGNELIIGAGYGLRLMDKYLAGTEFTMRTNVKEPFKNALASPAEWLLFFRSMPDQPFFWSVGGGLGLTSGYGSSEIRVLLSGGFSSSPRKYPTLEDDEPVRVFSTPAPVVTPMPTPVPTPTVTENPTPVPTPTPTPRQTAPIDVKAELKVVVVNHKGASMKGTIYIIKSDRTFQEKFETVSVTRKLDPGRYHIVVDAVGHKRVHEEIQLQNNDNLMRTIIMEPTTPIVVATPVPTAKPPVVKPPVPVIPPVVKTPKPKEKEVVKEKTKPKEAEPTANSTRGQVLATPAPVVFQKGKSAFEPSSFKAFQFVIKYIKEHPEVKKLNIQATVGDAGNASDNEDLAFARADAILEFFVNAGVDPRRLSSSGKVSSKTDTQSVEFIIQEVGKK